MVYYIETAFSCDLTRIFRHQRNGVRSGTHRDLDHLLRRRHLDVKIRCHDRPQQLDVAVLDMASVLAQMYGYSVRTGLLTYYSSGNNARLDSLAGFANCCNVVDIYV